MPVGSFRSNVPVTAVAATGLIIAAIYSLALFQRAFHGIQKEEWRISDLSAREYVILALLLVITVMRSDRAVFFSTLVGLVLVGGMLGVAASEGAHRVVSILVVDQFALFYCGLLLVLSLGVGRDGQDPGRRRERTSYNHNL